MNCAKVKSFPPHPNRYSTAPDCVKMPFMVRQSCYVDVKSPNTRMLFSVFTSPTKERLTAMRGTAPGRHTYSKCAPLQSTKPRALCLSPTNPQELLSCYPVLSLVESCLRAMSRLGSKEPNELFLLPSIDSAAAFFIAHLVSGVIYHAERRGLSNKKCRKAPGLN